MSHLVLGHIYIWMVGYGRYIIGNDLLEGELIIYKRSSYSSIFLI